MTHRIPVISSRNPISEHLLGKHRFDFCIGSPLSLSKAMLMLNEKPALVEDIINKNFAKLPTEDKARDAFINVIDTLASREGSTS